MQSRNILSVAVKSLIYFAGSVVGGGLGRQVYLPLLLLLPPLGELEDGIAAVTVGVRVDVVDMAVVLAPGILATLKNFAASLSPSAFA